VASFAAVEARHESAAPVDSLPVRQAFELKILRGGLPSGSPVDARTG
jgi:hypothetical protein